MYIWQENIHWRRTMVETTGATQDYETFRDFFKLRDQKTSGAMAPVAPPSSAPLGICMNPL